MLPFGLKPVTNPGSSDQSDDTELLSKQSYKEKNSEFSRFCKAIRTIEKERIKMRERLQVSKAPVLSHLTSRTIMISLCPICALHIFSNSNPTSLLCPLSDWTWYQCSTRTNVRSWHSVYYVQTSPVGVSILPRNSIESGRILWLTAGHFWETVWEAQYWPHLSLQGT